MHDSTDEDIDDVLPVSLPDEERELSATPVDLIVDEASAGRRLDVYLAEQFPRYSRVHLRKVINAAAVQVDGKRQKASWQLRLGQRVSIFLPELPRDRPRPEKIDLDILYEDDQLIVINKRPNMVVHPGKGHWSGTLTSALEYHFGELSTIGGASRPGIVHRLDRDTSGVMIVAKNDRAHLKLAAQFEARTIEKEYFAIIAGKLERDRDRIDLPIGFHPYHREKMAVSHDPETSRPASSFYEVIERFRGFVAVRILPKTGRTHQIRVHLAAIGAPVLCDRQYGGRKEISLGELRGEADHSQILLDRQALHARRLAFVHPATEERVEFTAPLAADMERVVAELRASRSL